VYPEFTGHPSAAVDGDPPSALLAVSTAGAVFPGVAVEPQPAIHELTVRAESDKRANRKFIGSDLSEPPEC
jgi:hypothetical protein